MANDHVFRGLLKTLSPSGETFTIIIKAHLDIHGKSSACKIYIPVPANI